MYNSIIRSGMYSKMFVEEGTLPVQSSISTIIFDLSEVYIIYAINYPYGVCTYLWRSFTILTGQFG
jgi:hypothetical protein